MFAYRGIDRQCFWCHNQNHFRGTAGSYYQSNNQSTNQSITNQSIKQTNNRQKFNLPNAFHTTCTQQFPSKHLSVCALYEEIVFIVMFFLTHFNTVPMMKARKSVREVMVMADPARSIVSPILTCRLEPCQNKIAIFSLFYESYTFYFPMTFQQVLSNLDYNTFF